ncbi:E4 SUMO-protein ligase PIAL2 isoform X1 [Gossypium hirsutum]|uniref:E4 SUMO-protein ligase PIAL2 isoform X1 n=1 Tax=Gossypium hirsutum TaxID=3635 RepID=A0ABM2YI47_GOSHI|nr:E4 SUMO-protein ligase PIAL2-like isoform X1 [Gossypium hirsutum]
MTAVPPAASGQPISASVVNSFRVAAVAERLATHTQPGRQPQSSEFFSLCLSLARGIDYAIANNEVPAKAQELPLLLKQICQHRNDLFLQAAIMVLMISVKNACKMSWFSDGESRELLTLANEVGSCFCIPGVINNELDGSLATILEVMSRFYPLMKMGQILASLEAKPGYGALVVDFHISKNMTYSPQEKIRLFVAQKDNVETSACIISPQLVSFLLNGKGVERRTNVSVDMGPQMPTNVTAMLKYGTNLLQAVGQFSGHYLIVVAFMSMESSSPDASTLPDYVQSGDFAPDSEDSDLIEGPSRISLKCPISRTRIKTPVKGHACKHLQCFDFNNYVNINSRRPSWRCPHCNQHVCYTNIRIDQNMVKVLKEVAEDVSDVIISADGSWKAVMENDDDVDELHGNTLNCQKDGSELPESATGVPMVLDLTQTVDAMETIETEDRKPPVATLQSLSAAPNLTLTPELINLAGANQNVLDDDFWAVLYSGHRSGTSTSRTDTQVGGTESTRNFTVSPVFSDAVSPAPNRADAHGNANLATPGIQNQVATANNLPLHPSQVTNSMSNHEYGSLQNIPRHVSRSSIAVQALPAMSQTQTPTQQRSSNSMNTMNTTSSARIPHQMQSRIQQERSFAPARPVQQVGAAAPSQLPGPYRPPGFRAEYQNPHLQQALNTRLSQPRSPSPGLIRSPSPILRAQAQQGAAQVGVGYTAGNVNSNPTRFMAASQRTTQMARQPPMVAVQTQTPRAASYPGNVDGSRASAVEQRLNIGGVAPAASRPDTSADLASEQNWRPTGRMRGSLTGRVYSESLSQMMIQPTQSTQAARPQTNITSPPSVPPHLQAFLANSRNPVTPQVRNNATTETTATNGGSGPAR